MENIVIITPVYEIPGKDDLIKDTKAVVYLCKKKEKKNIVIVYYYQHNRLYAYKNLYRLLVQKKDYKNHIYKDIHDNDVLLFEHPCIIPHRYKTLFFFDKKYSMILENYLKEKKIEVDILVVHFPSRFFRFTSRISAKKKVMVLHSFDVDNFKRLEYVKRKSTVFNSVGFRSKIIESKFINCKNSKLQEFNCFSGIPDDYISEKNFHRTWKNDNVLNLVFAGKLNKNKNVATVLKAVSQLSNQVEFFFTIIGDGEERDNLEKIAKELSISNKIKFIGNINREKVFNMFLQSDVFIMTSLKETLGLSYLEAMAAGNIVIGSKNRGIDGIVVDHENGFLVDPLNVTEIAEVIEEIYFMNNEKVRDMLSEVYKTIVNYSESKASKNYIYEITREL